MRFTTWSTLTKTFIISTVTLQSLIPAASAQPRVSWSVPGVGLTYPAGETIVLQWDVLTSDADESGGIISAQSLDPGGTSWILGGGVSINDKSRQVSFPTTPGNYEVVLEFAFLGESFPSGPFTLD